jgi:hypothetical protein
LSALVLCTTAGCIGAQLKFRTVIEKSAPGAGGWQETCLEANVQNMTTGDVHLCVVGIGMPVETELNGYISPWDAAEVATDCINEATALAIQPAPPDVPSALACTNFRDTVHRLLREKVVGSRVKPVCRKDVPTTRIGF